MSMATISIAPTPLKKDFTIITLSSAEASLIVETKRAKPGRGKLSK